MNTVPACCKGRVDPGRVRLNGLEEKGTCGMEVDAEAIQNTQTKCDNGQHSGPGGMEGKRKADGHRKKA